MKITGRQLRMLIRETIMNEAPVDSKLMINIMPATGAEAQLDGKPVETLKPIDLEGGDHVVTLMQGGKTASFKFVAVDGKKYRLVWNFTTDSHPPGGEIYNKEFTKMS
jgi:hypothetical protein